MTKFNKKYLNHSFIIDYESEAYKRISCEICDTMGWYVFNDCTYFTYFTDISPVGKHIKLVKLVLSCEEIQIKKLLE